MVLGSVDGYELYQVPISIKKPMGIAQQGNKLAVAALEEIVFFAENENVVDTMRLNEKKFDAVFIQRANYNTSTLDVHDIAFGDGVLWGVNSLFSCIATFDINYNFRPKWKPNFISELVPEDRCHLNGMVMEGGLPKYVTALGVYNEKEGWRQNKMAGGVLMEVPSSDIILDGLAMPHSPGMIEDSLYLLESGKGHLVKVDPENRTKELVFDFGCFVRGMSYHDGLLFVGKSKIRETSKDFNDLAIKDNSKMAGIIVFDFHEKKVLGEIQYTNTVEEIYDVHLMANTRKPLILADKSDKYKKVITFPGHVFWRKDEDE